MVGVSVSGYYCWRRRPPSARSVRHAMLLEVIAEIHHASRRTYGARRIHAELVHGRGLQVARCAVELVMRRNNLAGLPGRHRYRKVPNLPTATDLVDRRFRRDGPTGCGSSTSPSTPPERARSTTRWCSMCSAAGWWGGPSTRAPKRRWPPTHWRWP